MSDFSLTVKERKVAQKSKLTELRNNSMLPGVVYGFNQKPVAIEGDYREIFKTVVDAGTSNIIILNLGTNKIRTIVKEYQTDPVSDKLTHVDFLAVDDKRNITTVVPLNFKGTSKAVRELGGQLDQKGVTLTVKCFPKDLPSSINVDVSKLEKIGQIILVEDLEVGDNVEIINNPKEPIVSVDIPKKMKMKEDIAIEEAAEEAAEAAEEAAEAAEATGESTGKDDKKTEEAK